MTSTDVAFAMAGTMQAIAALGWAVGATLAVEQRRSTLLWAAYAGLSAIGFAWLIAAMHAPDPPTAELRRAAGNIAGIVAMMALQRGMLHFFDRRLPDRMHVAMLAIVAVIAVIGIDPDYGWLRVGVNSSLLVLLCLQMARDLWAHARDTLHLRRPLLMALPLLLAAIGHGNRAVLAFWSPESVAVEMAADSALNVGSSLLYVAIALAFHATLIALVVSRLFTEMRRLSRHDGLTGLLNRRAMQEELEAQLRRSRRSGESFVAMMLDLDHFKSINDRFGHAAGDLTLKYVSALLQRDMREADRLSRFGGEEFLVLLPGATLASAHQVAERFRHDLVSRPLVYQGAEVSVSVSIGLAQWHAPLEELDALLLRADAALYRSKAMGRNRVVLAPVDGVPAAT